MIAVLMGVCLIARLAVINNSKDQEAELKPELMAMDEFSLEKKTLEYDSIPYEDFDPAPAQAMIRFFEQNGKLLESKEISIGTYTDDEVELKTVFKSGIPETISSQSKTSKERGFYKYASGILVTFDSIDPKGNHIHHYVQNVRSNKKLPEHVITDFNE